MIQKLIPFGLVPGHWKLRGKERERAQAEYELSGYDLEVALININLTNKDSSEYKLAILEIDYKFKKITEAQYEKEKATIIGEPYFKVINGDYHQTGHDQGTMSFELDWNDEFVHELRRHGWTGLTADAIVDVWFEDACKQMFDDESLSSAMEETGPITANNRTRRRPYSGNTNEYS